jgi:uncharacterized membrane protein YdjX (TVP38/TMEM64 family)
MKSEQKTQGRLEAVLRLGVLLVVMGGMIYGIRSIGTDRLREIVESAGIFAPLAYIVLRGVSGFVPFASGPLQLASGVLFGFVLATLYSVIGSTVGYSISFWIARRYGRSVVERLVGGNITQVDAMLSRLDSLWGLAVARLVLYFTYDFVAYAAGLSKARYLVFVIVTFVLGIPPIALTVYLGLVFSGDLSLPFGLAIPFSP